MFVVLDPRVQRLRHENDKTGLKMAYLRHLMDEKRKQKMLRKTTSVSELKPTPMESSVTEEQAHSSGESMLAPLRRTSIEVRVRKTDKIIKFICSKPFSLLQIAIRFNMLFSLR